MAAFMTAPTLSIFTDAVDSEMFYSLNEEDTTSNENLKVFKVYNADCSSQLAFLDCETEQLNTAYLTLYTPYVTECLSPPPELA